MNKACIVILTIVFLINNVTGQKKIVKKVIILSRHNIRTPYIADLKLFSPKKWPEWKEESTYLTEKGALLERYMGEYFGNWLRKENILTDKCPDDTEFFAYANFKQRTKASAEAFVDSAFPDCNISVNITTNKSEDSIFEPVVHNSTKAFFNQGMKEMTDKMEELQHFVPFKFIEEILDYKGSQMCKRDEYCDLKNDTNTLYIECGHQPDVFGPINVARTVADAFVLEYYEGKEVAWGKVFTKQQWQEIMSCLLIYHDIKFTSSTLANDIARPLINYMRDIFNSRDDNRKVTLLMGHDANIITMMKAMNFRSFTLPKQFELIPIGGKVVFQKIFDEADNETYVKVDYVYQSTEQLRESKKLTLDDPPQWFPLRIEECYPYSNGYCKWSDFQKILDRFADDNLETLLEIIFN